MFSTVESLDTNRANQRLVASSIMLIGKISSPRPSNQSCLLVSHCTSSPTRLRRKRHSWISATCCFRPRHSLASIIHRRTVSRLTSMACFLLRYSDASVGQIPGTPPRQDRHRLPFGIRTDLAVGGKSPQAVRHHLVATPLQFPQQTPHVSFRDSQFCGCLLLRHQLLLQLFQGNQAVPFGLCHQQLSFWHPPSLGLSTGHLYFAQIGHYHFAATETLARLATPAAA